MCKRKDINAVLEQLQHCQDHEEKRRILEQSISCETCAEKPAPLVQGDIRCRCEIDKHTEFFNIIEHVKQYRVFEKLSAAVSEENFRKRSNHPSVILGQGTP